MPWHMQMETLRNGCTKVVFVRLEHGTGPGHSRTPAVGFFFLKQAVCGTSGDGNPRRKPGLLHMRTGGDQHKAKEHNYPTKPEVPLCHKE